MCLTRPFPTDMAESSFLKPTLRGFRPDGQREKRGAQRDQLAARPPRDGRGLALTERARRYHSRPEMDGDCDYVTLLPLGRPRGEEQGRGSSPVAQPMIVAPHLWRPSAPLAIAVSSS